MNIHPDRKSAMKNVILLLFALIFLTNCSKNYPIKVEASTTMYFPSNLNTEWKITPISELGWNQNAIDSLKDFLAEKNTKSFMILVNGKIVIEEYFHGHTANTNWEWNSAGKTLVATTIGIAQQEGLLSIHHKVSDYLGTSWTNMPLEKENLISVRHLLSMASGIDDTKQLVIKSNLNYVADAGTRWAYGNVFQKLTDIVAEASHQNYESYFNAKLKNKIGMNGQWNVGLIFTIFHSNTRSMARFGLLALNKGKWQNEVIIHEDFFTESIQSSQNINPSYGYLWWLNGKEKHMIPGEQTVFSRSLIPNAPKDMYAAMGAFDQRIYIVPSKNMVIVRMGNAANSENTNYGVSTFDHELWAKINDIVN